MARKAMYPRFVPHATDVKTCRLARSEAASKTIINYTGGVRSDKFFISA
jgi:hypothetical protein